MDLDHRDDVSAASSSKQSDKLFTESGKQLAVPGKSMNDMLESGNCFNLRSPIGVSEESWNKWMESRFWLAFNSDGLVYCSSCSKVQHLGIEREERIRIDSAFVNGITAKSKKKLLKKIDKHKISKSHGLCEKVLLVAKSTQIEKTASCATALWIESNHKKIVATEKTFRRAYMCAVEYLPFTKHPAITELEELNGQSHSQVLFSDHSCKEIIEHIATCMKSHLVEFIVVNLGVLEHACYGIM